MKSFLLSFGLTIAMGIFFMSVFDTKTAHWYRSLPDWIFITFLMLFFVGFLTTLYWGITGIAHQHRFFNLMGICFSLFGIAFYVMGFIVTNGKGKEKPGQFDHELNKIEAAQKTALDSLLLQAHTNASEIAIVPYWKMNKNPGNFVLCIQQGNIIGLQIKNKTISDVHIISELKKLNWLVLEHCELKSIAHLDLPELQRLYVKDNQLTSLNGLEHFPQLAWLSYYNNPITDSTALQQLTNKNLFIENY